jgi:hypothetical protein
VRKPAVIALGLSVGIVAEIGALQWTYAGANLFHGGHPGAIASVLLPGISVGDHLSNRVPIAVPVSLFLISLVQLPVYGALAGRDWADRMFSGTAKAVLLLHVTVSSAALYGLSLERRWEAAVAQYGVCIRTSAHAETLTQTSTQIVFLRKSVNQSRERLATLRTEKSNGAVFIPDPEAGLERNLAHEEQELRERWELYRTLGGTAASLDTVTTIPSPCGAAPPRAYLF